MIDDLAKLVERALTDEVLHRIFDEGCETSALTEHEDSDAAWAFKVRKGILAALRAAQPEPSAEPVAWLPALTEEFANRIEQVCMQRHNSSDVECELLLFKDALYAHPPAADLERVSVPRTEWEMFIEDYNRYVDGDLNMPFSLLRQSIASMISAKESVGR